MILDTILFSFLSYGNIQSRIKNSQACDTSPHPHLTAVGKSTIPLKGAHKDTLPYTNMFLETRILQICVFWMGPQSRTWQEMCLLQRQNATQQLSHGGKGSLLP